MVRDANGRNQAVVGDIPGLLESSVLDAITVVTVMSYNFPAGVKQHGSLFFVEQYENILFRGVYFVFNFSYQIIIPEFQILRAEERTFGSKIFSVSFVSLNRISSNSFLDFSVFFSCLLNQHENFIIKIFLLCTAS